MALEGPGPGRFARLLCQLYSLIILLTVPYGLSPQIWDFTVPVPTHVVRASCLYSEGTCITCFQFQGLTTSLMRSLFLSVLLSTSFLIPAARAQTWWVVVIY